MRDLYDIQKKTEELLLELEKRLNGVYSDFDKLIAIVDEIADLLDEFDRIAGERIK